MLFVKIAGNANWRRSFVKGRPNLLRITVIDSDITSLSNYRITQLSGLNFDWNLNLANAFLVRRYGDVQFVLINALVKVESKSAITTTVGESDELLLTVSNDATNEEGSDSQPVEVVDEALFAALLRSFDDPQLAGLLIGPDDPSSEVRLPELAARVTSPSGGVETTRTLKVEDVYNQRSGDKTWRRRPSSSKPNHMTVVVSGFTGRKAKIELSGNLAWQHAVQRNIPATPVGSTGKHRFKLTQDPIPSRIGRGKDLREDEQLSVTVTNEDQPSETAQEQFSVTVVDSFRDKKSEKGK